MTDEAAPAAGMPRIAWTTSRIVGSPEPPPPYRQVLRYPQLKFHQPLYINADPAQQRIWVATRNGKIWSFADRQDVAAADLFFDFRAGFEELTPHATATKVNSTLGLAFHPDYPRVPLCWIVYTVKTNKGSVHLDDGTRLSRFRVVFEEGVPRCDPSSERILLTWLEGGHNGGCVKFGPDGCLYVSAGDGEVPNPPDPRRCGQDVTNVMSTIIRLDVSVDDEGPAYRVPADNPFARVTAADDGDVDRELFFAKSDARPEIWAYGFRNPWRFNFSPDGQLWAGDVGWELYEMVYNVKPGANYGWSVFEGPQQVLPDNKRGPTPIVPPALSYSHAEGASVTGGVFYTGQALPELTGHYLFGDYETRRIWSAEIDEDPNGGADILTGLTDLVDPAVRIVSFGEDTQREPLLLHFDEGTIYGLERNPAPPTESPFPRQLSETGLFAQVSAHEPATGVVPFEINEPLWSDGTHAQRLAALPGDKPLQVLLKPRRMQVSSLRERMEFPQDAVLARTVSLTDDTGREVRLETQVLHFNGKVWNPYSYVWNAQQTDATLAPAAGQSMELADYGTFAERTQWQVASRSECIRCHNSWVGGTLAFTLPQLNVDRDGNNQLQAMMDGGWLTGPLPKSVANSDDPLVRPLTSSADEQAPLAERARSYLSVNCSHCHQKGAGGTATIDLRHEAGLAAMQAVDAVPMQGSFQLDGPAIVKPGDPHRSVLLYRMLCSGRGRMPHIGSHAVDARGVDVIRQWIASLEGPSTPPQAGLQSTSAAMSLVAEFDARRVPSAQQSEWLRQAREAAPEIRNLFVRFQPAAWRQTPRALDPAQWDRLTGDPARGQRVFQTKSVQCSNCHQVGGAGGRIGPSLDDVGRRLSAREIREALLEPSKKIDPRFTAWTAVTTDGKVHSGLLQERTPGRVVLRTTKNEDIAIAREELDELIRQTTSLMPDRLLDDLSDQQIVDLLAYLATLQSSE